MSGPSRAPIEPHRKRLLQPLHDRRELQPIGGFNIERQPFFLKPKPAKFEDKAPPRLAKHPVEDRRRLPPPEQGFTVIDCRPYLIPGVLNQESFLSHIISNMGFSANLLQSSKKKVTTNRKKVRKTGGRLNALLCKRTRFSIGRSLSRKLQS
jgi:hypothetical protein